MQAGHDQQVGLEREHRTRRVPKADRLQSVSWFGVRAQNKDGAQCRQAAISKLVRSKNTEQVAHYWSKKPATRGRGFFRCVKSNRCGFWAWSGLDDVAATGPLASDELPIPPPNLLTSPRLLSQSPPPSPSASQAETREGVRVHRLEAENAALHMELSSLQGKLSQCKDDLSLAEEKYDRLVAGIGRLLAAD
ncbi:hypothetical protein BS47DRAFT_1357212 [Hydnum rufescens UP504]|uniref:Uncharacterized protein n=1 Tax=Hydnum rufescens UP504 TaxID=1448309 RepID=A0A9P6BAM7_9AGAM|nr:hypothetical protein BS47DRAFT_1357212 [Hydnum rufescens UP504]